MNIQGVVTEQLAFLETDFGFTRRHDAKFPDAHIEYVKDPLSVDVWWGKGEIDVTFSVSFAFAKEHKVFKPYLTRTFTVAAVALHNDPKALEPFRPAPGEIRSYTTDVGEAKRYLAMCAELMRRHCSTLLRGDLAVLEELTRRAKR